MNYVIDSSSIINLHNADVLEIVCSLKRCCLFLSPLVMGECAPSCAAKLTRLHTEAKLRLINESDIAASLYLELLNEHSLGEGETECIAAAMSLSYGLCSDDRKARALGEEKLGNGRVVGTARLLRFCVEEHQFSCGTAYDYFQSMILQGGFLPKIDVPFFCG